jgi:colanic acid biosynthesis glycosyl transferase WcaI
VLGSRMYSRVRLERREASGDASKALKGIGKPRRIKLLIHGMNFYPELIGVGKYTSELAFYLAARAHAVEVITAPPHYPGWDVIPPYHRYWFCRESVNMVDVRRCPLPTRNGSRGLRRLIAPLSFAISAAPYVVLRILWSRPDVVFCVEPTLFSAPAALVAGKMMRARTILHVHDLEVDAAFEVGHLKARWLRKVATAIEGWLVRRFDRVVTISDKMCNQLLEKGVSEQRISVIRNWVDLANIYPRSPSRPNRFRTQLGIERGQTVVLYAGHVGAKQALHVLLGAARQLQADPRIVVVIAGDGPTKESLMEQSADLKNVKYLPLQPLEYLNDLLNMADLHVLPQERKIADLVLPSKLAGMLATGRPVIVMAEPETELARVLEHAAIIVPVGDEPALARALSRAVSLDLSPLTAKGLEIAATLSADRILASFELLLITEVTGAEKAMRGSW